jgi:hypothetical protein
VNPDASHDEGLATVLRPEPVAAALDGEIEMKTIQTLARIADVDFLAPARAAPQQSQDNQI